MFTLDEISIFHEQCLLFWVRYKLANSTARRRWSGLSLLFVSSLGATKDCGEELQTRLRQLHSHVWQQKINACYHQQGGI
ncbi:hypothetical protein DPMN_107608 [Dreissena polymorpha]|uniref:Uncharacterized protein n=1 Tax=Dreissena polymorpha TaxID=45954 RepID=A0A9D4K778_DREPO|nr:hypothetical protein DPMN_107608 [Dreissena polymorpha]